MKAVTEWWKENNNWLIVLVCILLLAAQLAAPLTSTLAQAIEQLSPPYTSHLPTRSADDLPGVARLRAAKRFASTELTAVLADEPAPAPQTLQLEWTTSNPVRHTVAAPLRLIELLAGRRLASPDAPQIMVFQ